MQLNLAGKLMVAAMGSWLLGKMTNIKLKGSPAEIRAVTNALLSSKRFQDELKKPGATVQSVADKLGLKSMSASQFERTFGVRWPL